MFSVTAKTTTTTTARRLLPRIAGATTRTFADVEVEHVRSQWKTYGNLGEYTPGKHHILTFNKISPVGLATFPSDAYDVFDSSTPSNAHAILLRSHKLQESDVPLTVRAIARYVYLSLIHI